MYTGYIFLCNTTSLGKCLRTKTFSCSGDNVDTREDLGEGSVVFFFNPEANTLVGPFTATKSSGIGLEPGTWKEKTDNHSMSFNIGVEWEEVHELKNAQEAFPFLKDLKTCKLSHLKTTDLLNTLKKAPLFGTE